MLGWTIVALPHKTAAPPLVAFPFLHSTLRASHTRSIASYRHTAYLAIFIPWHLSFLSSLYLSSDLSISRIWVAPTPSARTTRILDCVYICRRFFF
ncbi:hypothetical protein OG21DRAFT_1498252, partial [Imleria badia]